MRQSQLTEMTSPDWPHYVLVFASCLLLWTLLTGTLDPYELLAGSVVALAITGLFGSRLALFSGLRLTPLAPAYILVYLGHFTLALIRANIDLARRVLSPSLPIKPAVVEVTTGLKSRLGKLMLANTITLTPGTLTIDIDGDTLLVHWVSCPDDITTEQATRQIAAAFESNLARFLK